LAASADEDERAVGVGLSRKSARDVTHGRRRELIANVPAARRLRESMFSFEGLMEHDAKLGSASHADENGKTES
jgi:hypothetical protein